MATFIAVIDDDISHQFVSKKFLKATGHPHRLLQFYDGLEAIDYFEINCERENELPDIIFLDINMPYMDGWQFLDRLSTLTVAKKAITIYIVTSSMSPIDIEKAASYKSLAGYEVKPITKERLSEIIESTLNL
jgi:two-component system chemotaxis response regulator CheY